MKRKRRHYMKVNYKETFLLPQPLLQIRWLALAVASSSNKKYKNYKDMITYIFRIMDGNIAKCAKLPRWGDCWEPELRHTFPHSWTSAAAMDKLFWKYFHLNNQDWNLTAKIYFTVAITSNSFSNYMKEVQSRVIISLKGKRIIEHKGNN